MAVFSFFRRERAILALVCVSYIVVLGGLSILRHYQFQTQTWDMGIFAQTFWNSAHGRLFVNSIEEAPNHLGVHASFFLILLVPLYWLFESPYTLLIAQTLALALGAIPLYLLAKRMLENSRLALLFAVGYLAYPPLHWLNLFDFHEEPFFIPLFLWGIYAAERKRPWVAALLLLFAATVKENAALVIIVAGIWLAIRKGQETSLRTAGVIIAAATAVYVFAVVRFVMPVFGGGLLRLDRYAQFGSSAPEIVRTMLKNPLLVWNTIVTPGKGLYLFWLFFPAAFLPFAAGAATVMLAPGLLQNLLTNFSHQFQGFYQYDALLIPVVWISAVYGFVQVRTRWPALARPVAAALCLAMLAAFLVRSPLSPARFPSELFTRQPQWEAYRKLVSQVPDNAVVAAQTNMLPHVAHRARVYMLGSEPTPADVVLADTGDSFGFENQATFEAYLKKYLDSPAYTVSALENRYLFIKEKSLPVKSR